jgi:hypothetical protein
MNTDTDESLAGVFDTFPIEKAAEVKREIVPVTEETETEADIQYVRSNLYSLIEKGSEAVANALNVATESQHPRAYEVAGNLIKNIGDLTDKLINLQKAKAELNPKEDNPRNVNIDKAVFVGSTAELLKLVKSNADSK